MLTPLHIAIAVVVLLLAYPVGRGAYGCLRFVFSCWAVKRHYLTAWRMRARWRWLTRNLGLVAVDRRTGRDGKSEKVTTYPAVRFRPDRYGVVMKVRTLPGVGKKQWADQSEHLGNVLGCRRVQVTQPHPGRLIVRAIRRDPLGDPLSLTDVLAGGPKNRLGSKIRRSSEKGTDPTRVYVGRDQWGAHRWLSLEGIAGICVGGLPGYGKSSLLGGWMYQLAPSPAVQFAIIDGAGGVDYSPWEQRAWMLVGDELDRALAAAEVLSDFMRYRVATARRRLGVPNAWARGPSPEWPLLVTIWDECHGWFDLAGVKGNRSATEKVQRLTSLVVRLVKQSRKARMLHVFASQKQTADALPTAVRDVCTAGLSFATRTKEAAVAGLGEHIREYPEYCPTSLLERPTFIGVCSAALPDNAATDPFIKLRTGYVTDDEVVAQAMATASARTPLTELHDARRWARTAPKPPESEWLLPLSELAATNEQAGPAEQTPLRSVS